ncbi:MAG: hypothetical protein R2912_12595 [Eubacteriales bacterium]
MTSFFPRNAEPAATAADACARRGRGHAGGPQLRSIGTLGGNICNGVTGADTASAGAYDAIAGNHQCQRRSFP